MSNCLGILSSRLQHKCPLKQCAARRDLVDQTGTSQIAPPTLAFGRTPWLHGRLTAVQHASEIAANVRLSLCPECAGGQRVPALPARAFDVGAVQHALKGLVLDLDEKRIKAVDHLKTALPQGARDALRCAQRRSLAASERSGSKRRSNMT